MCVFFHSFSKIFMLEWELTNISECFEHLFRRKDYVMPFCQCPCSGSASFLLPKQSIHELCEDLPQFWGYGLFELSHIIEATDSNQLIPTHKIERLRKLEILNFQQSSLEFIEIKKMVPNESFYSKQKAAFYCFHSNKNILKSHFWLIRGKTVKFQGNFNYIKMAILD